MEVPNSAKKNIKVLKISTDENFMTTKIKIKMLAFSSTKDHNSSFIKANAIILSIQRANLNYFEHPVHLFQ